MNARRRRWPAVALLVTGAALVGVTAAGLAAPDGGPTPAPAVPAVDPLAAAVAQAEAQVRDDPSDAAAWARLGGLSVERARATGDPAHYGRAEQALDESLRLQPEDNPEALVGRGALANARHDFAAARDAALAARELRPDTAAIYGVLADALTQLGDAPGATAAVQRMLDLRPGVAAFTRAAYDLELQGRVDDARLALEEALRDATAPSDVAFVRYQLGELAFGSGDVDGASAHYEEGLRVEPDDAGLRQGRARVLAARGETDRALTEYATVTSRVPLPQYLQEYGELLAAAGRPEAAEEQLALVRASFALAEAQGATDDLAVALFEADHGDPAEALRRAEAEWAQRQPALVADALAWALHVNGRDAEALEYSDRAMATGWRTATLLYRRGMILAGLGRHDEAATALADALALDPQFSALHAPRARAAMAELRAAP